MSQDQQELNGKLAELAAETNVEVQVVVFSPLPSSCSTGLRTCSRNPCHCL